MSEMVTVVVPRAGETRRMGKSRDRLLEAIEWAEAQAEKAREGAEYYAAAPFDYSGHSREMAKHMTEDAERLEVLAEAARRVVNASEI